ncbi:putative PB1 domain, tetratricopeptide-like helical domain-containing protein [Lupinus albus]|uniref:Putative PB1 domain, tetratricopeptide-like helical domain-containing protein n=1 Tax=Lupinus albus TaxID=3870 RepID=A0A6A4NUU9_LUPAL|nr:putative PB1 domain, tetratricopeptide-like helical domain-containing protein [Lupinus albus]
MKVSFFRRNSSSFRFSHVMAPIANGDVELDSSIFLKRAHELKEEGNRRFQNKDFVGALQQYENALKLTPKTHPDRAVFHSNKAACLMQMKPIDYETVIAECTMALQVQPQFVRALLRRARAFEALGKYGMAMLDVQVLLGVEPNHGDTLEIAQRLRTTLGTRQEAQQDLHSRPSPAALGASAVRGAPFAGLGPSLPARPGPKKGASAAVGSVVSPNYKTENPQVVLSAENGLENKSQLPKIVLKPSNGSASSSNSRKGNQKEHRQHSEVLVRWRPLKLVYDHDIRLAEMPVNCSFRVLRELVTKRFPSSKSVLIKYKDNDGDLVTITSMDELRLAECSVDSHLTREPEADKSDSVGMLRLNIVEVSPEQEPPLLDEEEEKPVESEGLKGDESESHSPSESVSEAPVAEADKIDKDAPKEKPDAHIDLHELGMEFCSEALEEIVSGEEAQDLFDNAASKFQEVAALALFNWGNVYMCAARKRIPLDESAGEEIVAERTQVTYDWVKEKYSLARERYEQALVIKPDFYEGLLALGQQQFEMAKLHWSFALANKIDLSGWDPTETIQLFDSAEEKMKAATVMWETLEEQRTKELQDPNTSKKEELSRRRKKQGGPTEGESSIVGQGDISAKEAAEQAAVMRSQIHLFWGNMLYERSQVECKLGMGDWNKNLEAAVERFKLAGASEADVSMVLKNHHSNVDAKEGEVKGSKSHNPITLAK